MWVSSEESEGSREDFLFLLEISIKLAKLNKLEELVSQLKENLLLQSSANQVSQLKKEVWEMIKLEELVFQLKEEESQLVAQFEKEVAKLKKEVWEMGTEED